jgi:hypothetical protein
MFIIAALMIGTPGQVIRGDLNNNKVCQHDSSGRAFRDKLFKRKKGYFSMQKKFLSLLLITLMIAVSFPVATATEGATHHVYEGESIQDAIDNANPGDTIVIGPGEYVTGELLVDKPLILQGSGADKTILYGSIALFQLPLADGQDLVERYCFIADMTIDNIKRFDGYTFSPAITTSRPPSSPEGELDGRGYYMTDILVTNCIIKSQTGIYLNGVASVEVTNSQLYGFWPYDGPDDVSGLDGEDAGGDTGIYVIECGSVTISATSFMGFFNDAINTEECGAVCITNNIIVGCDSIGIDAEAVSAIISNNTLAENRSAMFVSATTAAVANNIVITHNLITALLDGGVGDIQVMTLNELYFVNNDIYKYDILLEAPMDGTPGWGFPVGYYIYLESDTNLEVVSGNIFENPQLEWYSGFTSLPGASEDDLDGAVIILGPGAFDLFKIQQTSPCRDAGINAAPDAYGNVHNDFFGNPRPQGGAYDIGAHELTSYSPASMQPMVMTALGTATQSWNSVIGALPDTLTGEQQALLDAIQALMEQAKSLGNPIAANGALQQALAQMEALMATL